MKFESIKLQVARGLRDQILQCRAGIAGQYSEALYAVMDSLAERRTFNASLDAMAQAAYDRVMSWDVRCVGKLRELFPEHFPKSLRRGRLFVYMEDSDDSPWVVEAEEQT